MLTSDLVANAIVASVLPDHAQLARRRRHVRGVRCARHRRVRVRLPASRPRPRAANSRTSGTTGRTAGAGRPRPPARRGAGMTATRARARHRRLQDPRPARLPRRDRARRWPAAPTSPPSAPARRARQLDAVLDLLAARDLTARDVAAVCAGAAGVDTPDGAARLRDLLAQRLPAAAIRVVHDSELILAAAGLDAGIAVIAGTGSVAWGRRDDGTAARAGGWGYLLGDEGSGYWVARERRPARTRRRGRAASRTASASSWPPIAACSTRTNCSTTSTPNPTAATGPGVRTSCSNSRAQATNTHNASSPRPPTHSQISRVRRAAPRLGRTGRAGRRARRAPTGAAGGGPDPARRPDGLGDVRVLDVDPVRGAVALAHQLTHCHLTTDHLTHRGTTGTNDRHHSTRTTHGRGDRRAAAGVAPAVDRGHRAVRRRGTADRGLRTTIRVVRRPRHQRPRRPLRQVPGGDRARPARRVGVAVDGDALRFAAPPRRRPRDRRQPVRWVPGPRHLRRGRARPGRAHRRRHQQPGLPPRPRRRTAHRRARRIGTRRWRRRSPTPPNCSRCTCCSTASAAATARPPAPCPTSASACWPPTNGCTRSRSATGSRSAWSPPGAATAIPPPARRR